MRKFLFLIALSLAAVGTVHAQGVVLPLPPEDAQRINAMLGTGAVGNPVPSKPINDAPSYFPLVIVSTPANPFVPKGMNPGETRSFSQQVSVNYLDNPSLQRYSGSVSGTYTHVGTYQVSVPAGTFNADLIRVKFQGNVGPAHTKDTQYNFFAPGVGVVAMITQEDAEAFWIFNIDSSTGKVLASQ